jgi:ABC-2 type transport system ATP-binding protein
VLTKNGAPAQIIARNLTKTFSTAIREPGIRGAIRSLAAPRRSLKTVVDNVSFTVPRGRLVALLGPNGAGKSTTIKMLTGILVPTAGEVEVAGTVPHRDREANARNIGAVFGQRTQLWWDLPARESFAILRDIYGIPAGRYKARLAEFDELLQFSEFWNTRVRHLSLGQRVRCDLAAALLHDPPIVFLDEPTIGMDVVAKEQVRQFLRHEVDNRGRTVLLTTHDMNEVARLAERVVLINHGRTILDSSLAEIRARFGGIWQIRVTLADPAADLRMDGLRLVQREGPHVVLSPHGSKPPALHEALKRITERYQVTDLSVEENNLEDVMRAVYLWQEADDTTAGPRRIEAGARGTHG